ncbi:hypothetical protein AVEN_270559-1 [Araneus ventricosus]|uniref:Uncharacterized protein n=1 Tax=Araneus ventricosus TaxID=182803 RepID=A0A4Y2B8C8_ARAVE|nr:hypothetical protein AVEN_270559-1 [Araneus ventricosus]
MPVSRKWNQLPVLGNAQTLLSLSQNSMCRKFNKSERNEFIGYTRRQRIVQKQTNGTSENEREKQIFVQPKERDFMTSAMDALIRSGILVSLLRFLGGLSIAGVGFRSHPLHERNLRDWKRPSRCREIL